MKYWVLSALEGADAVRDEFDPRVDVDLSSVPTNFRERIDKWKTSYEAKLNYKLVGDGSNVDAGLAELDERGILLAKELRDLTNNKVKYYSEALCEHLPT